MQARGFRFMRPSQGLRACRGGRRMTNGSWLNLGNQAGVVRAQNGSTAGSPSVPSDHLSASILFS